MANFDDFGYLKKPFSNFALNPSILDVEGSQTPHFEEEIKAHLFRIKKCDFHDSDFELQGQTFGQILTP